jgi:hypothetical protein
MVVVNFTFLQRARTCLIENLLHMGDERSGRSSFVRLLALTLDPLLVDIPGWTTQGLRTLSAREKECGPGPGTPFIIV